MSGRMMGFSRFGDLPEAKGFGTLSLEIYLPWTIEERNAAWIRNFGGAR